MQTHLESLTLAHIELGDAPDVAIERALAQFGASEVLSKQWRQEWEQTGHSQAFGPSLQVARQWYGGAVGLTMALLLVTGDLANQGGRGAHIANLLFMLTPLVVGVGIGRSVKYPVKATLAALKRFALPLLLTYVTVFTYAKGWHNIPDWHGVPAGLNAIGMCVRYGGDYGVVVGSIITLLQLVCWAVLGVPAAAFVTHYDAPYPAAAPAPPPRPLIFHLAPMPTETGTFVVPVSLHSLNVAGREYSCPF